jgi:Spy/CpxP family protein refolding chaperone
MTGPRGSRSRFIGLALIAMAFLVGLTAGLAVERLMVPRLPAGLRIVNDMSSILDKLSLTPEQRTRADAIIRQSGPRTREAMLEVAQRLRSVSDSVDAELRAVLTPEQRMTLDSLRRQSTLILKRKRPAGNGMTVDTILSGGPDTTRR